MNAPDPRAIEGVDYTFTSSPYVPFGSQDVGPNAAYVVLDVWDYGGFATVRATHEASVVEMRLPLDDNNNWIPDNGGCVCNHGSHR